MKHSTILIILALLFSNCKKDEADPDPCEGENKTSAQFKIYQHLRLGPDKLTYFEGNEKYLLDPDTVMAGGVTFEALFDADEYKWKIGDDPREWNTKKMSLSFTNNDTGILIPITLMVKRATNSQCFPDDNGYDTMVRQLFVIRDRSLSPIPGKYKGSIEDTPNELFTIEIAPGDTFGVAYELRNFPNGFTATPPNILPGYTWFQASGKGRDDNCNCGALVIEGFLALNRKDLRIHFIDAVTQKERVFRGTRVE